MSIETLTTENFTAETNTGFTLIDMYADWCQPCRQMTPIVEEFAEKNPYGVKVFKVNVDTETELAQKFNISSIPTFLIMKDGVLLEKIMGALPYPFFSEAVRKIITDNK